MPIISTFMYCEKAEVNPQDGKLNITNPFLALTPAFIPGQFSFAVAFSIVGMDLTRENQFQIKFFKSDAPDRTIIDAGPLVIPAGLQDQVSRVLPVEHKGIMINLDFRNIILREVGMYTSEVYLNGDKMGEYPIYAKGEESSV